MAKVTINLLPQEFREEDLKNAKFFKLQATGLIVILIVVFLSSAVVALRIIQSHNISQIQDDLRVSQQKITDLKDTQASLYILKDRLTTIDQYLGTPSIQTQLYRIIINALPANTIINSVAVDKTAEVLVSLTALDGATLDNLITNLINKQNNEGKFNQISLESVTRGTDGTYKVNIKIKAKS